jgi:hypothetical protein
MIEIADDSFTPDNTGLRQDLNSSAPGGDYKIFFRCSADKLQRFFIFNNVFKERPGIITSASYSEISVIMDSFTSVIIVTILEAR